MLENPVFKPNSAHLQSGILLYKNKNRKKVIDMALQLKPLHSTIQYTGGIREEKIPENFLIL
ncbi:hypothetical protein FACS189429_1460 [Bacteroidia bacterium]|nr:hypothetical protein FACS189429_1460 [Bacteroidia bacterium]GHV43972.1 hypothetical protein FACS1894180_4600 [Bacteroidia bacterium]